MGSLLRAHDTKVSIDRPRCAPGGDAQNHSKFPARRRLALADVSDSLMTIRNRNGDAMPKGLEQLQAEKLNLITELT